MTHHIRHNLYLSNMQKDNDGTRLLWLMFTYRYLQKKDKKNNIEYPQIAEIININDDGYEVNS